MASKQLATRLVAMWRDRTVRGVLLAATAVPLHVATAGWKAYLFIGAPSLFLAANVLATLAVAGVKVFAVARWRTIRQLGASEGRAASWVAHRRIGITVIVLAGGFGASCAPLLFAVGAGQRYDEHVAVALAATAFGELGVSIWGATTARHDRQPLVEAVKLVNVVAAVLLMVLVQAALLSLSDAHGRGVQWTGAGGVFLGSIGVVIGVWMSRRGLGIADSSTG